ncbi:LCP family protein [Vaginisenegalia massiliensis]|uniref:LCP family protein n=1 Tax=Vaginisenegalia massiliensis TaxID=2058294 RepID=UPI000F54908E|nr:LCP family protein [Vaginisenegalia massiliensis]
MKRTGRLLYVLLVVGFVNCTYSLKQVRAEEHSVMTFAIIGVDSGAFGRSDRGRSDVLMLGQVNTTNRQVKLISIPRDAYVEIPGHGLDKINHAYAFGGVNLTKQVLSQLFDLDVQHYLAVDMGSFEELVDQVGGLDVVSLASFSQNDYQFYQGQAVHLDGSMALAYARERYQSGGDYGRMARQRQLIQALIEKLTNIDSQVNFMKNMVLVHRSIETDLSMESLLNLWQSQTNQTSDVKVALRQLEGTGLMINGIYYDQIKEESLLDSKQWLWDTRN